MGGFAVVYSVVNKTLKRVEALKILNQDTRDDPGFAARFEHEARICAGLDHPNIVKIFDYGHVEDLFYFSMQYMDGPTVAALQRSSGNFSPEEAARLFLPILDAVQYSHSHGVIHRDIKPDNLILDAAGRPYIMDFGVAKVQSQVQAQLAAAPAPGHDTLLAQMPLSGTDLTLTDPKTILGSPRYLAPELLRGQSRPGETTDIYSLGATLYRMTSGMSPYLDEQIQNLLGGARPEKPRPLTDRVPGISPEFAAIVMKAISPRPEDRYQNATQMEEDLRAWSQPPASPSVLPPPPARARPPRLLEAILLLGVVIIALVVWRHEAVHPPPATAEKGVSAVPTRTPAPALEKPSPEKEAKVPPFRPERHRDPHSPRPRRGDNEAAPAPAPKNLAPATWPQVLTRVEPDFPDSARRHPITGSVGVGALVGPDGAVESDWVLSPLRSDCDAAVLSAVKKWKFKAAESADGTAVPARVALSIEISLGQQ